MMSDSRRNMAGIKMCLNHSQSGIEDGLVELEHDFRNWFEHPHQRPYWSKLMEHLVSFRWVLDQHFTRVAGEGYLEHVACQRPGLYSELRDIECWQCRLIDRLDSIIHDVQTFDSQRDEIADIEDEFRQLHREILDEESQERLLVERGLA
ncbi:MAG: hypothetical protein MUD03_14375 [Pirellula sp.]|nr:hypothetical protein [Pirellula sp.]